MNAVLLERPSKKEALLRHEQRRPANSADQITAELERLRQAIERFRKQLERLERQVALWRG